MALSYPTDRLLFLVYADRSAAVAAIETARDVRHEYGLNGALLLPQHIHSTTGTSTMASRRRPTI